MTGFPFNEAEYRAMAALMSGTTMVGFERQIIAPVANPFALNWVPAGSEVGGTQVGEYRPVTGQQDLRQIGGGSLHPGDSTAADLRPMWHHVTMEPIGEAFFDPLEEVPSADVSVSLGNTATLLKARIRVAVGNARVQTLDFDILAGVDFSVTGLHVLSIEALVPDPSSIVASPPDVIERSLATVVCTGVYCGLPPRGSRMPLTYSQAFFLTGLGSAIMPVVPGARELEIFTDEATTTAGGIVVTFLEILSNPIVPAYGPPAAGTFFELGSVLLPANASNTPRVVIPGQANAIQITRAFTTDDSVVNVVQILKF